MTSRKKIKVDDFLRKYEMHFEGLIEGTIHANNIKRLVYMHIINITR